MQVMRVIKNSLSTSLRGLHCLFLLLYNSTTPYNWVLYFFLESFIFSSIIISYLRSSVTKWYFNIPIAWDVLVSICCITGNKKDTQYLEAFKMLTICLTLHYQNYEVTQREFVNKSRLSLKNISLLID